MKMKVTLSPKEVEEVLRNYLSEKFTIVGEVKLEVGKELRGHYIDEHYETIFKGASCEVEL